MRSCNGLKSISSCVSIKVKSNLPTTPYTIQRIDAINKQMDLDAICLQKISFKFRNQSDSFGTIAFDVLESKVI